MVYLAIAFSSGELTLDAIDLIDYYFPGSRPSLIRFFGVQNRISVGSAGSSRRESVGRGRRVSEAAGLGGLVFAEESGLLESEIDRQHSSSSNLGRNADFGTDFIPVATQDIDEY